MAEPQEGLVSRRLNRRLSRPLARLLARTPATPNQVSLASFAIAMGAMGLFLTGHNVWGGVAAQASSVVDGADGDLARLKKMATRFGGYFDAVLDRYADVAILGGLAYWAYASEDASLRMVWTFGLLALSGALVLSYTRARAEASLGLSFEGPAKSLASRDARLLVVMIGAIVGEALITLAVVGVATNLVVLYRLWVARKSV